MSKILLPIIGGIFVGITILLFEYHSPWFNTKTESETTNETIPLLPEIIKELADTEHPEFLKDKLADYQKKGILAVGSKDDFEPPDGCYVFIFDKQKTHGVFLLKDERYFDFQKKRIRSELPLKLGKKQQLWVLESHILVQQK